MQTIRKAVIPVAGYGTRFLPATKAQPKEMLPLIDKPVIQFIVEEFVAAGIEEIVLVTSSNKRAIEDHFDRSFELESRLEKDGKLEKLKEAIHIAKLAKFIYVRQPEMLGNGHALLMAKEVIGDEPFAFAYGDDVYVSKKPVIGQMIDAFNKYGKSVVPVLEVNDEGCDRYGIVEGEKMEETVYNVKQIVEKPGPKNTRSRLGTMGRYVFTPRVFDELEHIKPGKSGEIWLVDAVDRLLKTEGAVAKLVDGAYYDCGNKLEFLKAQVEMGLRHPELQEEFKKYLEEKFTA